MFCLKFKTILLQNVLAWRYACVYMLRAWHSGFQIYFPLECGVWMIKQVETFSNVSTLFVNLSNHEYNHYACLCAILVLKWPQKHTLVLFIVFCSQPRHSYPRTNRARTTVTGDVVVVYWRLGTTDVTRSHETTIKRTLPNNDIPKCVGESRDVIKKYRYLHRDPALESSMLGTSMRYRVPNKTVIEKTKEVDFVSKLN